MTPAVSVVMAVRNGMPWVAEAVTSVLGQTLADLELIVIDDGSSDDTAAALAAFRDGRLRLVRQDPAGLTRSLNRGLGLARAPLVARLDADDTAQPDRLMRQAALLASRPDIGLVGTGALEVDAAGRAVGTIVPPEDDVAIRRALIHANPFVHSSVMFRRAVVSITSHPLLFGQQRRIGRIQFRSLILGEAHLGFRIANGHVQITRQNDVDAD